MSVLDTAEYRRLALIAAGVDPCDIPCILDTAMWRRLMLQALYDLSQGGGGGGGGGYVNGSVQFYADLPVTVGTPAVNTAYLVRENSGVWFINRRPAGIYVRLFNNGNLNDWDYAGAFPEVNDSQYFRIYDSADPTKELALDVSEITTATTRTLRAPDRNGRIAVSDYRVVASSGNLVRGDVVAADTTAGAFTLTLPASPANGDTVSILDYAGTFDTNNLTIARNGSNIESLAENMDCNIEDAAFSLVFVGSTVGWKVVPYFGNKTNFASPDPIGSSVANTGRFTTLTAGNGTITASAPVLDLSQTWNNAAVTFTGMRFNVTNTASAAASKPFDFQIGGTSVLETNAVGLTTIRRLGASTFTNALEVRRDSTLIFNVRDDGAIAAANGVSANAAATAAIHPSFGVMLNSILPLGWASGSTSAFGGSDLFLFRDGAAGTLAQRNGTAAQTFRLYNTFTDASNHERGFMRWSSNVLQIGTEKAGTGSARALEFQTDGTTRWVIDTSGRLYPLNSPSQGGFQLASGYIVYRVGSSNVMAWVDGHLTAQSGGFFQWSGGTDAGNFSGDWLRLSRSAGGALLLSAGTSTGHRLQFGGTTNAFPALKRSSTALQVRLADDSAYSVLDAQLRAQGTAPATSGAAGTAGDIRYDADYIYVCTAANTWKRLAIATW